MLLGVIALVPSITYDGILVVKISETNTNADER